MGTIGAVASSRFARADPAAEAAPATHCSRGVHPTFLQLHRSSAAPSLSAKGMKLIGADFLKPENSVANAIEATSMGDRV
jgi:hypothetical protein